MRHVDWSYTASILKERIMMPDTRILYIEDDAQHRRVIRTVLSHEGYTILEADNGCGGLAMAQQEQPALIVIDIRLPQMDGLDVVRRIRRTPHLARTPIIAVTANAALFTPAEYLRAGCDEVMFKPFQLNHLVESIRWLLSQANKMCPFRHVESFNCEN
jgi:CheY-like chemotaxis protein